MVWNSLYPDGTKSVKQNVTPGQQNTTYTETTQNNDHFWNIGTAEDGYHRKVSMENYADTASGEPPDPDVPTGMDASLYLKTVAGRVQGFYRNANGIFQFIPAFLTGSKALTNSMATVVAVPDDTFGQIFMWRNGTTRDAAFGYYTAIGGTCNAFSVAVDIDAGDPDFTLKFGNGTEASGLNIRARTSNSSAGTYQYRIMYWGM